MEEGNDLQVGAPMKGEVLEVKVAANDVVEKGQGIIYLIFFSVTYFNHDLFCNISNATIVCFISVVAVMSAMKMEMAVQVRSHYHTLFDPNVILMK